MANQEIGDLTAATTPLDGAEQVHIVQGGNSRRTTADAIVARVQGKRSLWVPADLFTADPSKPPLAEVIETNGGRHFAVWSFDASAIEQVHASVALPKSWDGGAIDLLVYWFHGSTTTNFGIRWRFWVWGTGDDDSLNTSSFGGNAGPVQVTGGTEDDLYITAINGVTPNTNPGGEHLVDLAFQRHSDHVFDTLAIDAHFVGALVKYNTNANTDD